MNATHYDVGECQQSQHFNLQVQCAGVSLSGLPVKDGHGMNEIVGGCY